GQFSEMGAGKLTVSAYGTALKSGLSETDLAQINQVEYITGISPTASLTASAARNGEVLETVSINGKNDVYFKNNDIVAYGRGLMPLDMEGDVYVCVIDDDVARKLFLGEDPLGKTLMINGFSYTVVGIQGTNNDLMAAMSLSMGGSIDGSVIIPYKNALKMTGAANVTSLEVYIADTDYTDQIIDDIEDILYTAFNGNDDGYNIFNMDELLDVMNTMNGMMATMLAGIASIALLVGGIGIMNMMLVSVTERTKEIGLRKALGAEPLRIQLQFLIESIVLSLVGGVIGIVLGLVISFVAAVLLGTTFVISWGAIALGFGFSAGVGILFGWVPAKKASELNPIDALRSE
ncbi:MAG: ABC transporter permease, partial [Alistipes sp.]|nr:ABC transporter permease [Alistipes sp.]